MDITPQRLLKILKIQQNIGKKLFMKDLTYQKLMDKINQVFELGTNKKNYHLYYQDEQDRKITINSPQDYQIFAESYYQKLLYVQETTKSIISMTNYKFIKQQSDEQMQVQNVVNSTTEQIQKKFDKFKYQLKKSVNKIVQEKFSYLESKYLSKDTCEIIHKQTKCSNCKSKNDIKGTLYKCVICELNLCFKCQQLIQHQHPFFKIISLTQRLPSKDQISFSLSKQPKKQQEKQQALNADLIDQFIQITECDRAKGMQFIRKHPKASKNELLQLYFNQQLK